jgi:hypothetical protein
MPSAIATQDGAVSKTGVITLISARAKRAYHGGLSVPIPCHQPEKSNADRQFSPVVRIRPCM